MTCFCELSPNAQMLWVFLSWLGCQMQIVLLVYRTSHRRAVGHTILDTVLILGMLALLRLLILFKRAEVDGIYLAVPVMAAGIIALVLYAGIGLAYEYRRGKREINEWSVKEAIDDLPMGLCFADATGRVILCNRKMEVLSHVLTDNHPQTLSSITGALAQLPPDSGVTALADVPDCFRFPDGRVYRFSRDELTGEGLRGYVQLSAHDETEIYEGNARLRENNAQLERVNCRLRKMYERMADDVREKESLDLKVYLHDTLGSSLLTVQDVKNSASSQVRQKLEKLKEAVGMLSASRPSIRGTFEEAQRKAEQMGVRVTLNGYIPPDTEIERLVTAAVRECVTNCIRHAGGDAVYVTVTERSAIFRATITNNGEAPKGEITEGSGLSSLRRSVEASGGEMYISHKPTFSLTLYLARKEDGA